MRALFGFRLFNRDEEQEPEPPQELTPQTIRSLLEVREEMRRARQNPRETLTELMRIGNRDLRPNARPAEERAALEGNSPFFVSAENETPQPEPAETAPTTDEASWTELDTDYLIQLLKAH